jgi:hypothetical protein
LGPDFNLWEWSDTWLTTSGVNILEPIVSYREDGSIQSLQIKQSCDLRGKNILRMQKIDVGLFDEHYNPIIIKDVIINNKDPLNDVKFEYNGPVRAIVINENDHGYCKVRYDTQTLVNFVSSL